MAEEKMVLLRDMKTGEVSKIPKDKFEAEYTTRETEKSKWSREKKGLRGYAEGWGEWSDNGSYNDVWYDHPLNDGWKDVWRDKHE